MIPSTFDTVTGEGMAREDRLILLSMGDDGNVTDDSSEFRAVQATRAKQNMKSDAAAVKSRLSSVEDYIRQQTKGQLPA